MTSLPPPVRPIPTPVTQEPPPRTTIKITDPPQSPELAPPEDGVTRRARVAGESQQVLGPTDAIRPQQADPTELMMLVEQMKTLPLDDHQAEAQWFKNATDALGRFRQQQNMALLQHLAKSAEISAYAAQTQEGADQQQRVKTLDEIGMMSQWSDTRSPEGVMDFHSALAPYLQDQDPEMVRKATEIADYHARRQATQKGYDSDVADLERLAKDVVSAEADDWLRAPRAIAGEALYSTFFKTQGGPQERIQSKLLDAVEERAARYKADYERSPYKDNKDRVTITPEAYRSTLLHHAMTSAANEIGDKDISEGFVERTLRGAAGFTGLPAVGAVGAAGKLITRADKIADVSKLWKAEGIMAKGLKKLGTMAPGIVGAGSIGGFIAASSKYGIPGLRETADVAIMDEDEKTREKAKAARVYADVITAGVTLPMFYLAQPIGRALTGGLLGKTTKKMIGGKEMKWTSGPLGFMEPVVGFTAGVQAATKGLDIARDVIEEKADGLDEMMSMWQLTHPKATGSIEGLLTNTPGSPEWNDHAVKLAEEVAPGMVFFGLAFAKASFARSQLTKRDIANARADVVKAISDPAVRKEMDERIGELENMVPDPTAKDELVERLGEAAANEKIDQQIDAARVKSMESLDKEKAKVRREREKAKEREDAKALRDKAVKELDAEERITPRRKPEAEAVVDAEAHLKDAAEARKRGRPDDAQEAAMRARVAEQAARDAAAGLYRDMSEVRAQVEQEAPQRNIREALSVEKDQEAAARELLGTELEREVVTQRAEALDAAAVEFAAREEVARADRAAAEAPPADPTEALANALANVGQPPSPIEVQRQALSRDTGTQAAETVQRNIAPGDRIDTARGEIEVDSVEPDGMVVGRDADGEPVVRRADELLSESPKLVSAKRKPKPGDAKRGRPKKVEATPADKEAAEAESREERLKAHEERVRQVQVSLQKAARITDHDERLRYLKEAAEGLTEDDIQWAMETEKARLERLDDVEAPPPGEDVLPEEANPTVRFINRASDMAQMLAKSKSWANLEVPEGASGEARSLLETAKQREPFYKNLEGEAKAAQAVYDHLRITELGAPGESLSFEYSAMLKRLDDISAKSADVRATSVQSLLEHHADLLTGEYAPVARMHPIGRVVVQRIEQAIAAYPKDLASGKLTIPSKADLKKFGMRAYTTIRSLWPWSTQSSWNFKAYSMSPRSALEMAKNNMANYLGDPSTKKSSWTRWFGAAESHDRGVGYALAHEMKVIAAKTEAWLKAEVNYIKGLTAEERVSIAEKVDDGSWRTETDPVKKAGYQAAADKLANFRDGLWDVHPDNYHGLRRIRVAKEFIEIAKAAPPGPHRDLQVARAEAYLKKVEKWHEEDRVRWARKDFVHHVRAATAFKGGSFSIGKRRKDPEDISPEAGDWIRDIAVANLDYGPKAIAAMHKNKVNRDTFEYLYGRQRAANFKEITTSGQRLFIDDVPHVSHGVVYVVEKKTKSGKTIEKIVPIRAEVQGAFEMVDGQRKKVWKDVAPPKGAKKRLLVETSPDDPSQGLYRGSRARTVNLIRQMNSHGQVAAKLLKLQDAVLSSTVVEPGFMASATEQRQAEMKSLFNRFNWGIDHLTTDVGAAKEAQLRGDAEAVGLDVVKEIERDKSLARDFLQGLKEGIGRIGLLSTKLKMTGVGSPLNILLGGLSMNSAAMPMNYMARAKRWTGQALWRQGMAKFRSVEQIDPAAMKPGDAAWERGRGHMRTNPKKLAKLNPDQMRMQEILDDAYVDMTASGLADHNLFDLDKKLPVKEGEIPTVKSIKKAMRPKFWDVALGGVRQADTVARMHNYLGIYVIAREAGKSRPEAHDTAMQSVAHNHGIFNLMTANPLLTSNFGKFALGLNGYVSRQFFIWAQAPLQYKLRFAAMTWGTNYVAQQIGLGDITQSVGTNIYDTIIGGVAEEVMLGGEEPLGPDFIAETGHLPVHMPTGSPMISAVVKFGMAVRSLASGDYQEGFKGVGTAASAAFRPAIIDSLNKAGLLTGVGKMLGLDSFAKPHEQDEQGNHLIVSVDQKLLGTNRTSYKLKHQGWLQLTKDALSGSQEEVAMETVESRVERAQKTRLEGQRANVKAQLRGLVRRYDEAQADGKLTQTMKESTTAEFKRLTEEGRSLGVNLADPSVRKQEFAAAREQNLVAKLPPSLRGIATAGSKELQVRFLTDALGRATESELKTLKTAIAGEKSLIEWARDPKRVSADTYRDFTAAIRAWRSSRAAPAPATPSTPR